jgi:hypothetical protein
MSSGVPARYVALYSNANIRANLGSSPLRREAPSKSKGTAVRDQNRDCDASSRFVQTTISTHLNEVLCFNLFL